MSERSIFIISGKRSGKTIALVDHMVKERLIVELEEIKFELCKLNRENGLPRNYGHSIIDKHMREIDNEKTDN